LYDDREVFAAIHRARRDWALDAVSIARPASGSWVLEAGVGAGGLAATLAQTGLRVVGLDGSARMLELTAETARADGVGGRVAPVRSDVAALPFRPGSFPVVLALGLLPWVDDPEKVVGELSRVTRPGGHLILTADNSKGLSRRLDPRINPGLARVRRAIKSLLGLPTHRLVAARGQTARELGRLVGSAGLELVDLRTLGFGPFTLAGRRILPTRLELWLDRALQTLADRGALGLRSGGGTHLVVARSPALQSALTGPPGREAVNGSTQVSPANGADSLTPDLEVAKALGST
jgi:SAM-dependent methyltransferase